MSERLRNDDTYVHHYDPSSVKEVIDARLKRQRHIQEALNKMAEESGPKRTLAKGLSGLSEVELGTIRYEATKRFFSSAKLPEELRAQRDRFREHLSERREDFKKNPKDTLSHLPRLQAVLFSSACEAAVLWTTGEFADMLTQAVIARRGRKDFSSKLRTETWSECLRFAMRLAGWEAASIWVDRAWGNDPRESPIALSPGAELEEQKEVAEAFSAEFRKVFEERMRHGSPEWLSEADRRIDLRCLLSAAPQRKVRLDASKRMIAFLLMRSPGLTTEQVCGKLDAYNEKNSTNAPVPEAWQKRGARSWSDAFIKLDGSVHTYVSNVRKTLIG